MEKSMGRIFHGGLIGMSSKQCYGRRTILGLTAGAAAYLAMGPAQAARRVLGVRSIAFDNLHTGEKLHIVYWENGRYEPEAFRQINWVLRDYRNDKMHRMDPELVELLYLLQRRLETREPFQILSGYRSPETNAMLAALTDGVAQNSLHMQGMAVDIRVPGRNLALVHRAAESLRLGGVGYYPRSDFVHVDTGRVRYW
jgi:uncharacterized protein YcbK (DUF882 family)